MGLSVVIPSRNFENLRSCVAALDDHNHVRLIVVDDNLRASGYDSQSMEYQRGGCLDGSEIIPGIAPFVFARAINQGIQAAQRDDVILLNDDALLRTPGGFTAMQKAAEEHPEYGIISATTNVTGNLNQLPRGIGLREEPRMVCFICVLIPRKTIDLVGLLDERFVGYGHDDDDYCVRLRRAGLKIGIFDGCYVDHGSLSSTFRGSALAPANLEHNARIFHEKYGATNREV